MSLNWSGKNVADELVLKDGELIRTASFATMGVGINKITEENYTEFYRRFVEINYAMGYEGNLGMNLKDVHKLVGFSTNAGTLTRPAFNKRLAENIAQRADEKLREEQAEAGL